VALLSGWLSLESRLVSLIEFRNSWTSGGSKEKPVGTVFIALASSGAETEVQRFRYFTDRKSFKRLTTQTALEMLRQRLIA
jgi:nicotinamide mononucleotide (NMN) deamidase PncC